MNRRRVRYEGRSHSSIVIPFRPLSFNGYRCGETAAHATFSPKIGWTARFCPRNADKQHTVSIILRRITSEHATIKVSAKTNVLAQQRKCHCWRVYLSHSESVCSYWTKNVSDDKCVRATLEISAMTKWTHPALEMSRLSERSEVTVKCISPSVMTDVLTTQWKRQHWRVLTPQWKCLRWQKCTHATVKRSAMASVLTPQWKGQQWQVHSRHSEKVSDDKCTRATVKTSVMTKVYSSRSGKVSDDKSVLMPWWKGQWWQKCTHASVEKSVTTKVYSRRSGKVSDDKSVLQPQWKGQ